MHKVRLLLISLTILLTALSTACSTARVSKSTVVEVTGTQAERVEAVTKTLTAPDALPSPILDARLLEERIGDGNLGPSDYRTFILIQVAPEDIPLWIETLEALPAIPDYQVPSHPAEWWPDAERFATVSYFAPGTLTRRIHGWIAVDAQRGEIFIYTFTT